MKTIEQWGHQGRSSQYLSWALNSSPPLLVVVDFRVST